MNLRSLLSTLVVVLLIPWNSAVATAFHLMQIEQVIGGVGGDPNAQAIQLRMRAVGQNQVQLSRIRAFDSAGGNPVVILDIPSAVANGALGSRVLIASPQFESFTDPAASPDFVMTNLIPASYLAAGSLTFEGSTGSVLWRFSWGGGSYAGPTTGSTTNDFDGEFGPPFPGPLPSVGIEAVRFQGPASALSTNNADDYALTGGAAIFTNNGGASFTVEDPTTGIETPVYATRLLQNHPNPFHASTNIPFVIGVDGRATVRIFDVRGRLVATLVDRAVPAGTTQVRWNGRDDQGRVMESGVYFYRLLGEERSETRKMVLLR